MKPAINIPLHIKSLLGDLSSHFLYKQHSVCPFKQGRFGKKFSSGKFYNSVLAFFDVSKIPLVNFLRYGQKN